MTERWAPIEGHPGYEVSDHGRVRSLDREMLVAYTANVVSRTVKGRMLKPCLTGNGYLFVRLTGGRFALVHRIVAVAFVANRDGLTVNHKDGDKQNNHFGNLEWVSQSENVKHSYANLPRKRHALIVGVEVGGVRYESILSAAKAIGVSPGTIHSALRLGHKVKGKVVHHA